MGRSLCITAVFLCGIWTAGYAAMVSTQPTGMDGQLELAWDNGTMRGWEAWGDADDTWMGVDFDIGMIQNHRHIDLIRVYSEPTWPNGTWDGFRVGVFSMVGSIPGSLLWGPGWALGTAPGAAWVDTPVDYTLPAGTNMFVAGTNQFYNYPNCDPWTLDNNPVSSQHSWWSNASGPWGRLRTSSGYNNLMIRVVVTDSIAGIQPSSLGRVKAVYF